ncbi:MAG: hypothetical protein F4Y67_09420 [Chloroflexi bacterium]|nr:hypothetical protein [Chloroflexota bacterium]MDE2702826.1 hypothetical protein [Chloroflexota bacterium]MDE2862147.1 hypothetical protein [Chloroflexota bacterium]MDE2936317.1 hypothetical protein [Chloroflexota bacterium]MXX67030.1 hypothetical protein [Chloroflexota bacterium]
MDDDLESRRPDAIPWGFWSFARVAYLVFSDNPILAVWLGIGTIASFLAGRFLLPATPAFDAATDFAELGDFFLATAAIFAVLFLIGLLLEVGVTFNGLAAYRQFGVDLRAGWRVIQGCLPGIFLFALSWLALALAIGAVVGFLAFVNPALAVIGALLGAGAVVGYLFVSFYFVPLLVDTGASVPNLLRESLRLARLTGSEIVLYWIVSVAAAILTSLITSESGILSVVALVVANLANMLLLTFLAVLRCIIYENSVERFAPESEP